MYSSRDIRVDPAVLAPDDPISRAIDGAPSSTRRDSTCGRGAVRARRVRVLHREDYSFGDLARLVPTDFAVGWGPMSDSAVLAGIEISQANRFYFWRTRDWPIDAPTSNRTRPTGTSSRTIRASPTCWTTCAPAAWSNSRAARGCRGQGGRMANLSFASRHGCRRCEILLAVIRKIVWSP
jgi:hypothetical protein